MIIVSSNKCFHHKFEPPENDKLFGKPIVESDNLESAADIVFGEFGTCL